jgi:hypothetical protein
VKRRTPPRHLTEAFHQAGLSWYLHGDQAPDHVLRLYDGGPACWLAQFDEYERPCSGELEVFHFISRQRIRNVLSPLLLEASFDDSFELVSRELLADLVELAEWDPRNAGPGCEGHHRRFDSHRTPELKVPLEALPHQLGPFLWERGLLSEAERKFPDPDGRSLELISSAGDLLPISTASVTRVASPPSEAGAAAGCQQQQPQPPLVGGGADNRGRSSAAEETRSSLSVGSGESGPTEPATGAAAPLPMPGAAQPDSPTERSCT